MKLLRKVTGEERVLGKHLRLLYVIFYLQDVSGALKTNPLLEFPNGYDFAVHFCDRLPFQQNRFAKHAIADYQNDQKHHRGACAYQQPLLPLDAF